MVHIFAELDMNEMELNRNEQIYIYKQYIYLHIRRFDILIWEGLLILVSKSMK